jgi:hypothetical protein
MLVLKAGDPLGLSSRSQKGGSFSSAIAQKDVSQEVFHDWFGFGEPQVS